MVSERLKAAGIETTPRCVLEPMSLVAKCAAGVGAVLSEARMVP